MPPKLRGKWALGIQPRNFTWIIKDRLAICERPGGYGVNHRRVRRQEEIICALKSREDAVENTRTMMESMALDKDKFSRRSTTKDEKAEVKMTKVDFDGGWDVDAYKMVRTKDGLCVPKALPPASF